ncbi:ribonuclease H protein, partial [Trifolium medium]|nr:ribonuclease H protein [Trifolium medium]
ISKTALAGNSTKKTASGSLTEFAIFKTFSVKILPPKAPNIIEVLWQPPLNLWVKCNIDGAAKGYPGLAACAGLFRDNSGDFIGGFAKNLGLASSLFAELMGAILAIEIAQNKGWNNMWLETDSKLVQLAFKSPSLVPWMLNNRWQNCLHKVRSMNFIVTHLYREGNSCADTLANLGLNLDAFCWWDVPPPQIAADLH